LSLSRVPVKIQASILDSTDHQCYAKATNLSHKVMVVYCRFYQNWKF